MMRCGCGCVLTQVGDTGLWRVVVACSLHFYRPVDHSTGD